MAASAAEHSCGGGTGATCLWWGVHGCGMWAWQLLELGSRADGVPTEGQGVQGEAPTQALQEKGKVYTPHKHTHTHTHVSHDIT